MPQQDFVYLGDNANAPYGVRSPEEVTALTRAAIERLFAEGCELVLIACNTASALALRTLQQNWLPTLDGNQAIIGVFVPLIEALTGRGWRDEPGRAAIGKAAFFATPATVNSGAFTREAKRLAPNLTVIEQGCPGLVVAIEEAAFRAALPDGTNILSQPQIVAQSLAAYLERHPQFKGGTGSLGCLTTGDPAHVSARAGALFKRPLPFDAA